MKLKRGRLVLLVALFCSLWLLLLLYTYSFIDLSFSALISSVFHAPVIHRRIYELMTSEEFPSDTVYNPLSNIIMQPENLLHFYHLPKRKKSVSFTEITSANRDARYPLAPDFTFHIRYARNKVVLYEDTGPGCLYRLYLFPVLPTNAQELHRLKSKDLALMYLHVDIDNQAFKFTLQQLMEGKQFPFISPINTQHSMPASGMGSYTPVCYQDNIVVSYIHNGAFPDNLFNVTIDCAKKDEICPVHTYSAVSRHKFSPGTKVSSLAESHEAYSIEVRNAAQLLKHPEHNGPDYGRSCSMHCVEICRECSRTLLQLNAAGVVTALKLRVFETAHSRPLVDWNQFQLKATFDYAAVPQINVPLGTLFGASGSLNSFRGAAIGRLPKHCVYKDQHLILPKDAMTGYMYLPMPFWHHAEIIIEGDATITTSISVCYDIIVEQNHYVQKDTAYLHANKQIYENQVDGFRDILSLKESWGHIVALYVDVDNLNSLRGPGLLHRWPALEADPVLFIDGQKSATMLGTGLEDYFSYAHGFMFAENTSYAFVGNHHAAPRRKEKLTWYCYRQHVLDAIPFQNSVHFYMEGTRKENFTHLETPLNHESAHSKKKKGETLLSHMVLFYAQHVPGMLSLGKADISKVRTFPHKAMPFTVRHRRYIGASNSNDTYLCEGHSFKPGDSLEMTFDIKGDYHPLVLRRNFYMLPGDWNEEANVFVNEVYQGKWFIAMGSLCEEYSLRHDDLFIANQGFVTQILVRIEPLSAWRDCGYELFGIV
ncbi:hypothetical protein CAPTEDRAFT_200569 [Capitella teleta]|uniref:Uncharacterized protein n=1 Tax=Capitella teleta TaxID=283909 RepID=R7T8X8_CAPTE|nr:hypothetical protein CAPTEDRAFT_200569 [Capitella teleta]|eukprot:ELT89878.1 hypothetical protein CAPTEDRAFT_200569 [Capitella teleta]